MLFFSVKTTLKIGNKVYIPCVCYEANKELEPTIKKLSSEGKAVIYPEKVAFQNGKVLPSLAERQKAEAKAKKEKKNKKEDPEGF